MAGRIAKSLGLFGLLVAWTPFLACNLLQLGGASGNTNDNTTDNGNGSTANLAVFVDPDSNFSTSDVRDVNDEIVRFDPVAKTIIWAADGTAFDAGSWDVNGVLLAGGGFTVLFGTKNGERGAYFTETVSKTLCDIALGCGSVCIFPTSVTVPQE